MTSPVICNSNYIKYFIKELESKFPFPFQWVDNYTLGGLDAYEEWLDEQKKYVEIKRTVCKEWMEKLNITEDDSNDAF